jgi:hypothetical protein
MSIMQLCYLKIMLASAVLESQLWTLEPDNALRIRRALKWAKEHAPKETDVDGLVAKAEKHGKKAR